MSDLKLSAGPLLEYRTWEYDEEKGEGTHVTADVTAVAHQFLFDTVEMAPDVTLADLFRLIDQDPVLPRVLRRDFCEELLVEARKGISPQYAPGYDPQGIEYLELYQSWGFDSATKTYSAMHRLEFHGLGYELREALDEGCGFVYPKGHRIQWGISLTPVRELLALPVRVRQEVPICEENLDTRRYGQTLDTVNLSGVSLGQILHGVLWELSFHGGPDTQEDFREDLQSQVEEIKADRLEVVESPSGLDVFEQWDAARFAATFDSLGAIRPRDVSWALRKLEDDQPVQDGLRVALGDDVVVKPEYAQMPAMAFRQLFRTIREDVRIET